MKASLRDAVKSAYHAFLACLPDEWAIQIGYLRKFGRLADLRNPRTFSEKVNWRKLHQRDPRFSLFDDKVAVKDEIAALVGPEHVVPTLWAGERPEDIPFSRLAPPFVIKVNHGFGGAIFVRSGSDFDRAAIVKRLKRRLSRTIGRKDVGWGFYDKATMVLVERMLSGSDGKPPDDYKFFVYHGRVHFIQLDSDRWAAHERAFFDRDWNKLPIATKRLPVERVIPAPSNFAEMLRIAERVGSLFDFVRVDLYTVADRVYFGETTFFPSGGYSRMSPPVWDLRFGEPWRLVPYPPKTLSAR